jgi:hypothetical protein
VSEIILSIWSIDPMLLYRKIAHFVETSYLDH